MLQFIQSERNIEGSRQRSKASNTGEKKVTEETYRSQGPAVLFLIEHAVLYSKPYMLLIKE